MVKDQTITGTIQIGDNFNTIGQKLQVHVKLKKGNNSDAPMDQMLTVKKWKWEITLMLLGYKSGNYR